MVSLSVKRFELDDTLRYEQRDEKLQAHCTDSCASSELKCIVQFGVHCSVIAKKGGSAQVKLAVH